MGTGAQGPIGPTGPTGPQGNPGPTTMDPSTLANELTAQTAFLNDLSGVMINNTVFANSLVSNISNSVLKEGAFTSTLASNIELQQGIAQELQSNSALGLNVANQLGSVQFSQLSTALSNSGNNFMQAFGNYLTTNPTTAELLRGKTGNIGTPGAVSAAISPYTLWCNNGTSGTTISQGGFCTTPLFGTRGNSLTLFNDVFDPSVNTSHIEANFKADATGTQDQNIFKIIKNDRLRTFDNGPNTLTLRNLSSTTGNVSPGNMVYDAVGGQHYFNQNALFNNNVNITGTLGNNGNMTYDAKGGQHNFNQNAYFKNDLHVPNLYGTAGTLQVLDNTLFTQNVNITGPLGNSGKPLIVQDKTIFNSDVQINGGIFLGPWRIGYDSGTQNLIFNMNAAVQGTNNQPHIRMAPNGNIWTSTASGPGWIADNIGSIYQNKYDKTGGPVNGWITATGNIEGWDLHANGAMYSRNGVSSNFKGNYP